MFSLLYQSLYTYVRYKKMQLLKFHCIFVFFQNHFIFHVCNSLPTNRSVRNLNVIQNNDQSIQNSPSVITYTKFLEILSKYRCASNSESNHLSNINHRQRRDINGGSIDMKALINIVNDTRIIIQYLSNHTINHTFLAEALLNHRNKAPSLTNWRDIVDIICITIFIFVIMYYLICRIGLSPCDRMIVWGFTPVINRIQRNKSTPQDQQTSLIRPSAPPTISEHLKNLNLTPFSTPFNTKTTFDNTIR